MNSKSVSVVVFCYLFAVVYAAYDKDRITSLTTKCNATPEDTATTLKYQVPETPSGKCLMLCMLKELSMLDANGKYDEPAALVAFRKYWTDIVDTKLQSVNSNCAAFAKTIDGEPVACEYGYKIMKCINTEFIKDVVLKQKLKDVAT